MRTRSFGVCFVLIGAALALCGMARGTDVTYAFTGTGTHGSLAWGKFTTAEVGPDYYAEGNVYSSFSLTISNIPGVGPGLVIFQKTELEIHSIFSTDAGGTPSILPLGDHVLDPDGNFYRLSGGVEANQSTLTYNNAYRDDINWSALIPISPPPPPILSAEPGADNVINLSWTTNATDFTLEETASLAPPNWAVVTNMPVSMNENFLVTLPKTDDGEHFFRLEWLAQ